MDELVHDVRVPPDSIRKCQKEFIEQGLKYFMKPERKPTWREANVEKMLAILENPPPASSTEWESVRIRYIGIYFTARQIKEIRDLFEENSDYNNAEVARKVCHMFGLYQKNGMIKKSTVVTIFRRMAMDNMITINQSSKKILKKHSPFASRGITRPPQIKNFKCHELRPLHFVQVKTKEDSSLWNYLIEHYHYINQSRIYGPQMRYLVYGGKDIIDSVHSPASPVDCKKENHRNIFQKDFEEKGLYKPQEGYLLALLGFGPSAWRLESRDEYIGWSDKQRIVKLHMIVNNVRFLILPWIKSANLASQILSGINKQLPNDWEERYGYRPLLLETFVQLDRFRGTCYKAANWLQVGTTKGYNLINRKKKEVPTKAIFVYPLDKSFRRIFCNKPDNID